ncbi:hypothetical protein EON65_32160 [archaeon]|nr:MAG: hypothetical protein EON65_32160 [archaeon]
MTLVRLSIDVISGTASEEDGSRASIHGSGRAQGIFAIQAYQTGPKSILALCRHQQKQQNC